MAIGKDNSRATSYELEVLTLVNNEGDGFDIRNQLIQCKIYESITANFLIGNIVIDDGINLFEKAKIFGQESLRIKYSQPAGLCPTCICLLCSFFSFVLCMAEGFVLISSRLILWGNGWWHDVVIPLPNHIVALYHLAAQKLADFGSNFCFLNSRSSIVTL